MKKSISGARYLMNLTAHWLPDEEEWYDSVGLALQILGKHWYDDTTPAEDAFILAFADTISPRPAGELPCAPCTSAAGREIVHGSRGCARP